MPLIFLPSHFARRADLYHQLASLTDAGLNITATLKQLVANPPARSFRPHLARALSNIESGNTLAESLGEPGEWLPAFDLAIIKAGEHSGRLESCFRSLAAYYSERASVARQLIGDMAYPVFLLHFAVFIFPFPHLFLTGDWRMFLKQVLPVLAPLYLGVGFLVYAMQGARGQRWRSLVETLCNMIPALGTSRKDLTLSRLSSALVAMLGAGVSIIEAWVMATEASGSQKLKRIVLGWQSALAAGQTPAEMVNSSRFFPEVFASQYAAGEISGKLDETLERLHTYYQEEGTRRLRNLAQWTPRVVYLAVALMIGYRVISFYSGYFKQIQDAGGF
jgi:type II secretory pathway component PulF